MAILGALLWLASRETDAGRTKLDDFLSLGLNEMGDTIAGLAATLALLWLIVTAFMQRAELRDQRRQLELATHESERMSEALEAQAEVFRDEQRQRAEDRADTLLLEKRESLVFLVRTGRGPVWETAPNLENQAPYSQRLLPDLSSYDTEAAFLTICEEIVHRAAVIWEAFASGGLLATPEREAHLPVVCAKLEEIVGLCREFSPGRQEYLERVRMCSAAKELRKMIESDLWAESEDIQ